MDKVFGYACVRYEDEKLDYQINLLKSAGVKKENIFIDKKLKNKNDYTKYQEMKQMLRWGNKVVFCNIDKIGENIGYIYDELEWYKERGIRVKILELQVLNSTGLDDKLIQLIIDEIFSFLSILEKKRIRRKQALGIQRARKKGNYK